MDSFWDILSTVRINNPGLTWRGRHCWADNSVLPVTINMTAVIDPNWNWTPRELPTCVPFESLWGILMGRRSC